MSCDDNVAFFGIAGDRFSADALAHLQAHFSRVDPYLGTNDVPPTSPDPGAVDVDWLFSFKTKTIFREPTIASVRKAALNFHTAAPEYPGSGGVNWVLYNDDPMSAITVHHVTTSVDAGQIVLVDRFAREGADTVADLLAMTYRHHLDTFKTVTQAIAEQGEAWVSSSAKNAADETWGPKTYRLRDLEELKRITTDMPKDEVKRRIKATRFGKYGPYIELHGYRFTCAGD